jgi:hypothetical protein
MSTQLNGQKNSDTYSKFIEKLMIQDISYSYFLNILSIKCLYHILIEKTIHIQWKIYAKI